MPRKVASALRAFAVIRQILLSSSRHLYVAFPLLALVHELLEKLLRIQQGSPIQLAGDFLFQLPTDLHRFAQPLALGSFLQLTGKFAQLISQRLRQRQAQVVVYRHARIEPHERQPNQEKRQHQGALPVVPPLEECLDIDGFDSFLGLLYDQLFGGASLPARQNLPGRDRALLESQALVYRGDRAGRISRAPAPLEKHEGSKAEKKKQRPPQAIHHGRQLRVKRPRKQRCGQRKEREGKENLLPPLDLLPSQ